MCGGITSPTSVDPWRAPRGCSNKLLGGFTKGGTRSGCSWMRRHAPQRLHQGWRTVGLLVDAATCAPEATPNAPGWMLASSGQVESDKKREGDGSLAESTSILQKTHVCQAVFSWVKFENLATVSLSFLFGN